MSAALDPLAAELPTSASDDLAELVRKHVQAVDRCHLANMGVAKIIGDPHPPATATAAEGLTFYGGEWCDKYAWWIIWRAVELNTATWDALQGVKPVTPTPPIGAPEPDEALGLAVEPAVSDDGIQHQRRLTGA